MRILLLCKTMVERGDFVLFVVNLSWLICSSGSLVVVMCDIERIMLLMVSGGVVELVMWILIVVGMVCFYRCDGGCDARSIL